MIICLVCCLRAEATAPGAALCAFCAADLPGAQTTVTHRRQMSEARLGGALAKLAQLIRKADEPLGARWDRYLMAQAETPRTPQTQRRLDAMAAAYKACQLDSPMIDLLYAEEAVGIARDAVVRDDVAIQCAERAIAALSLIYEFEGRWTRHGRDGGHYLRRVADGVETSPYTSLEAALQAAAQVDKASAKMRVIIAGSRHITDYAVIEAAIAASGWADRIGVVVSGGQRGVDSLGELWAKHNNILIDPHPADWAAYGDAAGPKRNAEMTEVADALIAIPRGGPGTRNMITQAQKRKLHIFVYESKAA